MGRCCIQLVKTPSHVAYLDVTRGLTSTGCFTAGHREIKNMYSLKEQGNQLVIFHSLVTHTHTTLRNVGHNY